MSSEDLQNEYSWAKSDIKTKSKWGMPIDGMFCETPFNLPHIPAGVYTVGTRDDFGLYLKRQEIVSDEYIPQTEGSMASILEEFDLFWSKADVYAQHKFVHKRGILLYGMPGCGKTVLINQAVEHFSSKYDGVTVLATVSPGLMYAGLELLRKLEPTRPLLIIFEDIDAYIAEHGEERVLSFLDGETVLTKCCVIATTNYPEKLDARIICRPRRFDRIVKVEPPTFNMRRDYLIHKTNIAETEAVRLAELTEGYSFAALSEFVISVKCLDVPEDKVLTMLKDILENQATIDMLAEKQDKTTVTNVQSVVKPRAQVHDAAKGCCGAPS